jgi:flagellin-like hook-associated protein FlgL
MRYNLYSLQQTNALMARTQERLSSGLRVNSALDDPVNFFAAENHRNRASDLSIRKDAMEEAIQTIKAADNGITAITDLIAQAKSLVTSARTASASDAVTLGQQYNEVLDQINAIATDSNYKGTNLLSSSDSLTIEFNESASSSLSISGFDGTATGSVLDLSAVGTATGNISFTSADNLTTAAGELDDALDALRAREKTLSSNLSIVTARQDFTQKMIDTLQTGADNLTLADMNEESANMLMLQTRQALGTTSLSLASQAAQSVLRLF